MAAAVLFSRLHCKLFLSLFLFSGAAFFIGVDSRSFTIDYDGNSFSKDGQPFR